MTEKVDQFVREVAREYLAEAPARLGELRKDLAALRAGEPGAAESLMGRFHRLAGSGGSYGFPDITAASRDAEQWLTAHSVPDAAGFALLAVAIGRVAAAFDAAARAVGLPAEPRRAPPFGWRAHLVGGAADVSARLAAALRDSQYAVTLAPLDVDPARIPASERPEIAVILPGAEEDPSDAVERWTSRSFERRFAVALVADLEGAALLQAPYARLDLIASPARADALVTRWARAAARAAASPALILAALSDAAERATLATWLEAAGLQLDLLGTAREAEEALGREHPDLVLVDHVLPDADGLALVRLLRREPRMALTPVIAITDSDSDPERELALEAGVDELVVRPLAEGRLVPAIVLRAARARRLDEVVRRDPLTGLLTASSLYDEMESVLAFARRAGERISFVLFDLDHFRRLNEQLGYQRGDVVLAHVARVILERVRATDLVVRMGGEEFGVLLRTCGPADALTVAEQIRAAVALAPPPIGAATAALQLSGGIAAYPDHAIGIRDLIHSAERALRLAKEGGRDRVVMGG
jgi:diguanylate cyclase (GGDEF)-like protein